MTNQLFYRHRFRTDTAQKALIGFSVPKEKNAVSPSCLFHHLWQTEKLGNSCHPHFSPNGPVNYSRFCVMADFILSILHRIDLQSLGFFPLEMFLVCVSNSSAHISPLSEPVSLTDCSRLVFSLPNADLHLSDSSRTGCSPVLLEQFWHHTTLLSPSPPPVLKSRTTARSSE